jgi:hypothetical protein
MNAVAPSLPVQFEIIINVELTVDNKQALWPRWGDIAGGYII